MIQDLEHAKKETWEEKERLSLSYEEERTKNLASKVSTVAYLFLYVSLIRYAC